MSELRSSVCEQLRPHGDVRLLLFHVLQSCTQELDLVEEVHHTDATSSVLAAGALLLRVGLLLQVPHPSSCDVDRLHPSFHNYRAVR